MTFVYNRAVVTFIAACRESRHCDVARPERYSVPMDAPVRVLIVDDHDDVRRALVARLSVSPLVQVVGNTAEPNEKLVSEMPAPPDVVLVETKRADGRGLEIVRSLVSGPTGAQVIVLTSYHSEWERLTAFCAGAARYLLKDIGSPQLIDEIRAVASASRCRSKGTVQPSSPRKQSR